MKVYTKLAACLVAGTMCLAPAHVQASPFSVDVVALVQPPDLEEDDSDPVLPAPVVIPKTIPQTSYVKKGQKAPFEGVLMNPAAAAKISVERDNAEATCKIKVDHEVQLQRVELQLTIENLQATNTSAAKRLALEETINKKQVERLSSELEREQKRAKAGKWGPLYYVGGVVTGVLVIIAGAYAVRGVNATPL